MIAFTILQEGEMKSNSRFIYLELNRLRGSQVMTGRVISIWGGGHTSVLDIRLFIKWASKYRKFYNTLASLKLYCKE